MKKEKLFILLTSLSLCLAGCSKEFDPFGFNNVEIISSEEASYISNEATNNLSSVNRLRKTESRVYDYRLAYQGSASSLARYDEAISESEVNIYSHGYINETSTKETQGDGFGNTIYFEAINRDTSFLDKQEDEQSSFYKLYQINEYINPNYSEDSITSLRSSYFSSVDQVEFSWDKHIRSLVGDGYSYNDFSYGSSGGKIYAFIQEVSQNSITNPLHSDQIIITYKEQMVVRYFNYDANYGWVIDYFAKKENLYWVTSLEGEMYENPLLVESSQSLYQYEYGNHPTHNFTIPTNSSSLNAYPVISSFTLFEDGLTLVSEETLDEAYLITNYSDDSLTYLSSLVDFSSDMFYLFSSSNTNYTDAYLGYDILNYDQLSLFSYTELDTYKYIQTTSSVRVYLIFGFTQDGELACVDAYYWSFI